MDDTDSTDESDLYHVLEDGTKWPNCPVCHSEDTTVVPKTEEWTCQDCGYQWHSDEMLEEYGDAGDIPTDIEDMVRELVNAL